MRRITVTAVSVLGLALACSAPEPVAPRTMLPGVDAPGAAVLPASSYTATVFKPEGEFTDVNGRNLIVGTAGGNAVAMPLGGALTNLSNGPGIGSRAEAVNQRGEIVGAIDIGAPGQPREAPAWWGRVGVPPITLNHRGVASDINDQGIVVGTVATSQGTGRAFAWNTTTGVLDWLPALAGGTSTVARAINNDRIVLGWSDANGGIGSGTVLWQHNGSAWLVYQVTSSASDIVGFDIDAGKGIVGHTMLTASFGDPHHAGYFNVSNTRPSYATAVTGRGIATGWDEGVLPPGVPTSYGYGTAFIADRAGATTYLPYPVGPWRASAGHGLNECGLVVGEIWRNIVRYPVIWDPGC